MKSEKSKLLFLVDSEAGSIDWLSRQFDNKNYSTSAIGMNSSMKNRTVSWRRSILYYKYIQLSLRGIRNSGAEDVIVSWNFIVGAFAAFFCKISGIKRTILSLNMISYQKGFINTLVRKLVYDTAFRNNNFYITVNSNELIGSYSADYRIKKDHFFILPDCIKKYYETASYTVGNGTVFSGGEGMRDWNTLFKAAELLPDTKFIAIARKKNFDTALEIPKNVSMYFDTDYDFFYNQLKESSVVAIPLSTTAPAGLIVMIRAALLSKPIIITSTSSARNYIENNVNGILIDIHDYEALAREISALLSDSDLRKKLCENMRESIQKYTPENYANTLENYILQIKELRIQQN
jgi:glycosyltransferase involved in cell wall biosynthesis